MTWGQLLLIVTIGEMINVSFLYNYYGLSIPVLYIVLMKNFQARDGSGAPCSVPSLTPKNFYKSIVILNATNRTLFSEINSDTSLKGTPSWRYENTAWKLAHVLLHQTLLVQLVT